MIREDHMKTRRHIAVELVHLIWPKKDATTHPNFATVCAEIRRPCNGRGAVAHEENTLESQKGDHMSPSYCAMNSEMK